MSSPPDSFTSDASATTHSTTTSLPLLSPTVDTKDGNSRSQPWRDIVSGHYWAEPHAFREKANAGPRRDIRLLQELDAKSR
ncbi:uncharacterized protein SPSK_02878 [Sporothrix schenckii 1099-18]|uniref:Uncharacterized protein n=2 Tax=Sporothrix schenckii TaxID=29908 RepID=U7PIS7_SPOS1|nr:uncharacterized protein SPSK_02878 [Sporothrix schenckii 1099-18]ERS95528.1 hypothetical protein HMPREF1624_08044 [Sporothrix schenckii ATCC 58251]KJR86767.1 hypothetical protein SPSK_02878 [Sporothrix schenckii 1099-18]